MVGMDSGLKGLFPCCISELSAEGVTVGTGPVSQVQTHQDIEELQCDLQPLDFSHFEHSPALVVHGHRLLANSSGDPSPLASSETPCSGTV